MEFELRMSKESREAILDVASEKHFESNFGFLKSHNGLRRGKIHTIIAPTGSGKSTLIRSLISDILENNPDAKIALYLSEDKKMDFAIDLAKTNIKDRDINERLKIFYEADRKDFDQSPNTLYLALNSLCNEFKPDVFIMDNITTASAYMDVKTSTQGAIVKKLISMTDHYNCASIIVAHTDAKTGQGIIDPKDVRGSKHLPNLSQFLYVIQQINFFSKALQRDLKRNVIMVRKHRGYSPDFWIYGLEYNSNTMVFDKDRVLDFETFKEAFKRRNTL